MQAIKSKGTRLELILSKALWGRKLYYRKNDISVFGKPDFTFKKLKIAVFVDSEFFHGYEWEKKKHKIKSNQFFWWRKIEGNIKRDIEVNEILSSNGWIILRFWGFEIKSNLNFCVDRIEDAIKFKKSQ